MFDYKARDEPLTNPGKNDKAIFWGGEEGMGVGRKEAGEDTPMHSHK